MADSWQAARRYYFQPGQSHEEDSFIIRYQSNGAPDATFGDASQCDDTRRTCQGVVTIDTHPVYGWIDAIAALALQPDGKVTSVGRTLWTGYGGSFDWSTSFALTRVRPDGILDETFGYYNSGVVNQLLPPDAPPQSAGYGGTGIALDASGRIVAVGGTSTRSTPLPSLSALRNFAVARFTGNGLLDGVFNGTGLVETDFFGFEDAALGVALQADGRIVVVGFANTSETTSKMAIARYEGGGTCTYSATHWAT